MMSAACRVSGLVVLVLVFSGAVPPVEASTARPRTLSRFHDPVILQTSSLNKLAEHRTANYRVYSASPARGLEPIPFQFDARDDDGDMILDTEAGAGFTFDQNDELLFMAKDTGGRVEHADLPAASDAGLELEVTDPLTGEKGWAYLLHFPDNPPAPSPVTYAKFDAETNQATGKYYTIGYFPERNFFTGMTMTPAAGDARQNILDRLKIRVNPTFALLFGSWSPRFTEEDFSVEIDGVKNGPVRAIRRVRQALDLGKFFPDFPNGTVYTYYYFSSFTTPSKFSISWLVLKLMRSFRFIGVNDFRRDVIGMTYWDGANPAGLRFTGHSQPPANTTVDHDWWAISGAQGACVHIFPIPQQWLDWGVIRGTVFMDDDEAVDEEGPEAEPGAHAAGYSLLHLEKLRRPGKYDLNLATVFLPHPFQPGDEKEPLAMIKHPLLVEARPVE